MLPTFWLTANENMRKYSARYILEYCKTTNDIRKGICKNKVGVLEGISNEAFSEMGIFCNEGWSETMETREAVEGFTNERLFERMETGDEMEGLSVEGLFERMEEGNEMEGLRDEGLFEKLDSGEEKEMGRFRDEASSKRKEIRDEMDGNRWAVEPNNKSIRRMAIKYRNKNKETILEMEEF